MTNNEPHVNTYVASNQQLVYFANPLTTTFEHFFHVKNIYVAISDGADVWLPFTGMRINSIVIATPIHHQLSGVLIRLPDIEGCLATSLPTSAGNLVNSAQLSMIDLPFLAS